MHDEYYIYIHTKKTYSTWKINLNNNSEYNEN